MNLTKDIPKFRVNRVKKSASSTEKGMVGKIFPADAIYFDDKTVDLNGENFSLSDVSVYTWAKFEGNAICVGDKVDFFEDDWSDPEIVIRFYIDDDGDINVVGNSSGNYEESQIEWHEPVWLDRWDITSFLDDELIKELSKRGKLVDGKVIKI